MKDLREWLARAEALGELKTLKGVHWDLEIGAITEMVGRQLEKPAILFDEVPGYPPGHRVLVNALGSRNRYAMTVGFPEGLSVIEMVQEWRRRSREMEVLPPRVVDSGPVMENAAFGEEVDLLKFPTPKWHEGDGGRFIGTGDVVVTRDPEGDWINLGTYRLMLHDRNRAGLAIAPGHHGRWHLEGWHAKGKPMPIAVAIGADPLLFLMSFTEVPSGIGEYDLAGGIRGEPVEVIRGPITGLPIPATAEIVIEGFVHPEERFPEGPFGEFTGYYAGGVRPLPVVRVEGLYHRNDPIILGSPPLKPLEAQYVYRQVMRAALFWDTMERAGIPDVTAVWPHVAANFFVVVALKQRYPGHAKQAGRIATQCYAGMATLGRFTVVVDDDIDVTDIDEVLWAMCTRVDPERDIEVLRECVSTGIDPMVPPEGKAVPITSRVIIDATRPYQWRDRFPEVVASSPELKQRVLAQWGEKLKGIV
ncbi:MAG TPA: UbiD family decarboxylase [Dehalococcoidia bacterium]|nr:UbiD family decarboxylase [Dehalococcoidia bacterium]